MTINVVNSTLRSLQAKSDKEIYRLIDDMEFDGVLYTEVCFPEVITKYLTEAETIAFLNGSLDRSIYVPEHHEEYYEVWNGIFRGDVKKACMIFFRQAAKTTIKRISLSKNVCYAHKKVVPLIGVTEKKSVKDIAAVQRFIMYNKIIQFLFGNMKGATWNALSAEFYSPNGTIITYTAHGITSQIRGELTDIDRPELICIDEYETPKNTMSEDQRNKIEDTIYEEIFRLGEGNDRTSFLFTGTIPHPLSFSAKARDNEIFKGKGNIYLEFPISKSPSITRGKNGRFIIDDNFDPGPMMWDHAYSREYVLQEYRNYKKLRKLSSFFQELYNIPKQDTESKFKVEMIRELDCKYIAEGDITYIEKIVAGDVKRVNAYAFTGHDPASGRKKKENDFTSTLDLLKVPIMTANGKDHIYVILDIFYDKIDIEEQRDTIFRRFTRYKSKMSMIETFNMAWGLYTMCVTKKKKLKSKINLATWEKTTTSKSEKFFEYLEPIVNKGKIYYIKGCKNVQVLKDQLKLVNSNRDHDDTVDALFLAYIASEYYEVPMINVSIELMNKVRKQHSLFKKEKELLNYVEL